ncbi:MAG: hypothetical protein A2Y21_00700 [Clostridiales bacterium GWC2_40_7]|nr:MAG: hypothetical protein A2Y21_00700 [Clostridiales bacterium GWC2_40_7]
MESKGTFFILIIVVAVLTLTLAALAGYLFLVQGTPGAKSAQTQETEAVKEIPKEADLTIIELYEGGKKYFNLKNDDDKIAVIQVNIALKHFNEIKENKKIKVAEKMQANVLEIKELVSTYFMQVTLEDVKHSDAKEKAKVELKKQINELLNEGEKEPYEFVYKVIIDEWLYQ